MLYTLPNGYGVDPKLVSSVRALPAHKSSLIGADGYPPRVTVCWGDHLVCIDCATGEEAQDMQAKIIADINAACATG